MLSVAVANYMRTFYYFSLTSNPLKECLINIKLRVSSKNSVADQTTKKELLLVSMIVFLLLYAQMLGQHNSMKCLKEIYINSP